MDSKEMAQKQDDLFRKILNDKKASQSENIQAPPLPLDSEKIEQPEQNIIYSKESAQSLLLECKKLINTTTTIPITDDFN